MRSDHFGPRLQALDKSDLVHLQAKERQIDSLVRLTTLRDQAQICLTILGGMLGTAQREIWTGSRVYDEKPLPTHVSDVISWMTRLHDEIVGLLHHGESQWAQAEGEELTGARRVWAWEEKSKHQIADLVRELADLKALGFDVDALRKEKERLQAQVQDLAKKAAAKKSQEE